MRGNADLRQGLRRKALRHGGRRPWRLCAHQRVFDSFTVTAMVDGKTGHSATPTAGNIADATLRVTLKPTTATSTLAGVTGTVYAPIDAGEITAAISRSDCNSRIGSRSIRVCADVSSATTPTREQ